MTVADDRPAAWGDGTPRRWSGLRRGQPGRLSENLRQDDAASSHSLRSTSVLARSAARTFKRAKNLSRNMRSAAADRMFDRRPAGALAGGMAFQEGVHQAVVVIVAGLAIEFGRGDTQFAAIRHTIIADHLVGDPSAGIVAGRFETIDPEVVAIGRPAGAPGLDSSREGILGAGAIGLLRRLFDHGINLFGPACKHSPRRSFRGEQRRGRCQGVAGRLAPKSSG